MIGAFAKSRTEIAHGSGKQIRGVVGGLSHIHRQGTQTAQIWVSQLWKIPEELWASRSARTSGIGPGGSLEYLIPVCCPWDFPFYTVRRCVELLPESRGRYDRDLWQSFLEEKQKFSDQVNFGNDTCLQITLLPILWEVMWFKNIQILILLNPMFSKIPDYKARWGIMVSTEPWMENITPNVFILGVKKLSSWYTSLHHSNPHN